MRRVAMSGVLVVALALGACGGGGGGGSSSNQASSGGGTSAKPQGITIWVGFTNRELGVIKQTVAAFHATHPKISVKVVGGVSDDRIIAAIRSGNAPDVVQSFTADNTGAFCSSGGWIDLKPLMARDHVDASIFPKAVQDYTQYQGTRCALPMLADTYGLYYNKAMFKKAGIASPPKTFSELTADAKKLTVRQGNTFKVVGYDPAQGFYENAPAHYGPLFGAQWVDGQNQSVLSKSPGWMEFLKWQKDLIDFYGFDRLSRWQAGAGDEFSAQNAFERGKIAMAIDGEFRTAFIKAEHPELDYGTAPMPVADSHPELYGAGYVTGNIIGIPKTAKHKDAAWELVKYLTTDEHALALMSNGLRNVPTTTSSLSSTELAPDPRFKVFLDIFANPKTATTPITAAGSANQELFQTYVQKIQSGRLTDMAAALAAADKQIDAQLAQSAGKQVP
ncbi:MAG: multiple sugar transport system substrate-binding protein [Solirubrobacteraceae bacterium]|nr:multiple sugar transport system substrate-binding protein [Solirubrobacteraceae bacterium]